MNERELFLAALEIEDPAARFAYLESVCDGELRAGVAALLASHQDHRDFLQIPAAQQVMNQLDLRDDDGVPAHEA